MIPEIKDRLRDNTEDIHRILEKLSCTNIKPLENEFRFGLDDDGSGTGNKLDIHSLKWSSFSRDTYGDIITLVSDIKKIKIGSAIKWLANELNIEVKCTEKVDTTPPFGAFWKEFNTYKEIDDSAPLTYPMSRLNEYKSGASKLFIKDNISAVTQEEFGIGYDIITDRITIPWFDEQGNLVGIMGRMNKDLNGVKTSYKYLPIIPFSKSKVLYGFYQNYRKIVAKECAIVAESEKSPMQGREYNIDNVVSLGGNSIKPRQAKLLKSTFANIILALDEGISLEHCIKEAKKVKIENPFFSNEVYIVDMDNPYVIKGSKVSLFDLSEDSIEKILKNHLIYID